MSMLPSTTRVTVTCSFFIPSRPSTQQCHIGTKKGSRENRAGKPGHGHQGTWQCVSFLAWLSGHMAVCILPGCYYVMTEIPKKLED